MKDVFYYTDRELENNGEVTVWVFKKECPECGTRMEKPRSKTGKPIKKSEFFVCPKCGYQMNNKDYENDLIANVRYTCPECGFKEEKKIPFKRKKKKGALTLPVECSNCHYIIDVTKKFKKI